MLLAQKSLEEVEESIAKYLPKETIEVAHARFLSRISLSNPDALYLLAVGRPVTHPLTSRLEYARIKSARKNTVGERLSRVAVASSGGNQRKTFVISYILTMICWLTRHLSHQELIAMYV